MADSGVVQSVEGVANNLGENDGCSITPAGGPEYCKSCRKTDCDLCPCSFDPNKHIKGDEGYPCLQEKLEKTFINMKIWLAGCSAAERVIQSHVDKLKDGEAANKMLFKRVGSLATSLSTCSIDLLPEHSTHDALRVEVVSWLLHSTSIAVRQGRLTLLKGIVHLESLTEDKDYFNQQVAAYGYAGITLTTAGSLQVDTTNLINNGNIALQKLDLNFPDSLLLSDDDIRAWYCHHCIIFGDCCFQLKEYEGSNLWYEASLRVAKIGYPEIVSHVNRPDFNAESSMAGTQHNKWKTLAADIHSHIGRMYHNAAKYEEALKHWCDAAELHDDRTKREDAQAKRDGALTSLLYSGDAVKALDAIKKRLLQTSNLDSNSSMRRAELLVFKCRIEAFRGDSDDSILSGKEAKILYEEKGCLKDPMLNIINLHLLLAYSRKHDYQSALGIVNGFEYIIDMYHKDTSLFFLWKALKAHIYINLGDLEMANGILDQVEDIPYHANWKRLAAFVASVRAKLYLYEDHNETETAQDQYQIIEDSIREQVEGSGIPPNVPLKLAGVENMLNWYLTVDNRKTGCLKTRYDICRERVDFLRNKAGQETELARALLRQAVTLGQMSTLTQNQASEFNELIDEAIQLVETRDHKFLAILKFAKTVFPHNSDPSTGEAEGRDAAFIFAELQLNLKDLDSGWISMFEFEMMHVFNFMELFSLVKYNAPMKALLWAERGRMRLFMHLTEQGGNTTLLNGEKAPLEITAAQQAVSHVLEHQKSDELRVSSSSRESLRKQPCPEIPSEGLTQAVEEIYENTELPSKKLSDSDKLWFDRDDARAENYLFDAIEKCGPGALILEYTVREERYIIYVVFISPEGRRVVEHEILSITEYYSERRKGVKDWQWGKTLKELVFKIRGYIAVKKDKLAMVGLSMLNHLLIEPVGDHVMKCKRLILAVQGDLAMVPFAAIYNKRRDRFLVQEKILSYIPSIRVLHYCLHRQRAFEQNMQNKLLGPPFIAGNPGDLPGWGMKELKGASEEATLVARFLGVKPHIGLDMNKSAVKNGLSKASIVLLATHGLVNQFYPHGALILKDLSNASSSDLNRSSSMTLTSTVNKDGDATISSDEIARLPGGIRAGLVVLSACETGMGKVTNEGLLGLGRSLLQGGAPTAILTLWKVGDSSNKVLVEGLFQQLVESGKDAAESLQLTMQQMIEDETNGRKTYSIYHWAPLVVLGSPFLKYNSPTHVME